MPKLSPELEKLLSFIPKDTPAADREGMTKFVQELQDSGLRQEEFSRKMNEVGELKKQYETGKEWVDTNRTYYKQAIAQRDEATLKAKEAEERLQQLTSGNGNQNFNRGANNAVTIEDVDMDDPAQVAAAIKQARQDAVDARAEALRLSETITSINDKLTKGELLTRQDFETEGGKKLDAYGKAIMGVMSTITRAKNEFDMILTEDQILAEADKNGGDLDRAYQTLTAEKRLERDKAAWREENRKEWEAEQAEKGNPVAPGAPPAALGPMQARVLQRKQSGDSEIDPSIPADGSGRLAHAIAQELRAEGKA